MLNHLYTVYGCYHLTKVELSRCNKDKKAHQSEIPSIGLFTEQTDNPCCKILEK